jgi:polysaccharide export outer membrane protein
MTGDRLRVQVASQRFSNRVVLEGAVQRPGVYGHFEGMRLSALLRDTEIDLLENTDLGYGLVVSTEANTGLISVAQFAPSAVLSSPEGPEDRLLEPRDRVLIFTRTNSEGANREALLGPVLAQLDRQASPESPVPAVSIAGAVQAPGRYPLGEGYTVADLIQAAGGFRDDAYLREIEIQRVFLNRESVAEVRVRTVAGEGGALAEAALGSRDRVLVRTIPNWQSTETVELAGEFRFPGTYNLLPGETLGELIDRAGGVTYEAFPYGAVYTAKVAAEAEQEEMRRFVTEIRRTFASSSLTQQQQMASYQELEQAISGLTERDSLGRIAIDLPRILAGDRGADLPLSDGDRIFLPRRNESITVLGEVFRPGSFRFEEGQSLKDYLALGAGTTVRADEKKIYIVRADGRVDRPGRSLLRFGLAQEALRPGDTIIVPLDASYRDPLNFWTEITQVAFQTGIAVAAVLRN